MGAQKTLSAGVKCSKTALSGCFSAGFVRGERRRFLRILENFVHFLEKVDIFLEKCEKVDVFLFC